MPRTVLASLCLGLATLPLVGCGSGSPIATAARAAAPAPEPPPAEPAPFLIQGRLSALASGFDGEAGVAVMDLERGWIAAYRGEERFPQQSVSKLWVALAVLDRVDRGELSLDTPITIPRSRLSIFNQPIAYRMGPEGGTFTVAELVRAQIADSDNTANDALMRAAGGPAAVRAHLMERGLRGVTVYDYEPILQSRIAGLQWDPSWAGTSSFGLMRARLSRADREAAMDAYVERPVDGASPEALVRALAAIERGRVLSPTSTAVLVHAMTVSRNGRQRLKGGLPPGWRLHHKTGTGQDLGGRSVGINDVGVLTAPDGRKYAVAVMIGHTRRPTPARLEFFQAVTRTVAAQWEADRQAEAGKAFSGA